MIECQVLCVFVIAAILAAITIADIDAGSLHCRLASIPTNMNVMPQADDRRDWKRCRRRMENVIAVVLFNKHRTAKPQAYRTSYADGAQRLV